MGGLCFVKMDEYQLKARFYPCIVSMLALSSYVVILINMIYVEETEFYYKLLEFGFVVAAASFFLREFCRSVSKHMFQFRMSKEDETDMPTTKMLLYKYKYLSKQTVDNIVKKINADLQLKIDPNDDSYDNRKVIAEAVQSIRGRYYNNKLLKGYNIAFGFRRNLMGGIVVSTGILIFMQGVILIFYGYPMEKIAAICFLLNAGLFGFAWLTLMSTGRSYARQLFAIYLGDRKNG